MRLATFALALLVLSGTAAAEPADDLATVELAVPGADDAVVVYPKEWSQRVAEGAGDLPQTLRLRSQDGAPMSLQITLIPDPTKKLAEEKELARAVLGAGQKFAEGSVEKKIQLVRLESTTGKGLYANFTDARWAEAGPPPGEYRHATVGAVSVGDAVAAFTLLSNDLENANYQLALLVLGNGIHRLSPAAPAR